MREFETAKPWSARIHPALPREPFHYETSSYDYSQSQGVCGIDQTTLSSFCRIGPNAHHGRCVQQWCKCQCHDDAFLYGYCG